MGGLGNETQFPDDAELAGGETRPAGSLTADDDDDPQVDGYVTQFGEDISDTGASPANAGSDRDEMAGLGYTTQLPDEAELATDGETWPAGSVTENGTGAGRKGRLACDLAGDAGGEGDGGREGEEARVGQPLEVQ